MTFNLPVLISQMTRVPARRTDFRRVFPTKVAAAGNFSLIRGRGSVGPDNSQVPPVVTHQESRVPLQLSPGLLDG